MQIRTQMFAALAVSAGLGLVAAIAIVASARRDDAASDAQARAQTIAHEVSGLLALTQEYALHGEASAAEQWRRRERAMAAALGPAGTPLDSASPADAGDASDIAELRTIGEDLPGLFERLEALHTGATTGASEASLQRQQAALIDQLLTNTQAMADGAYRWFQRAAEVRRHAADRFKLVALAAPLLMLAMLAWVSQIMRRAVLPPLQRLTHAAAAVGRGDLSVRIASDVPNELGDLSRQFDAMIAALTDSDARLRRSEAQLRAITDNLPALVVHIDTEQRYTFVNAHTARVFGIASADMLGRTILEVRGEPLYRDIEPHALRALAGEQVVFEKNTTVAGRSVHYQSHYVPDVDDAGQVRGYFAMTFDLTARRAAELAMARSEQRLLDLTNSIPAMVAYFDMDQRCQYANDTSLASLGLERGDLARLTLRTVLGETHFAQHEPYVKEALAGRRARLETRIGFGGRDAHFQAHLIPDRIDGGAQRGFYLMTFDITALKEAQERQAQVERQLRAVTDNLPALISYIDRDERFTFLNRTFHDWWGIAPATVLGRHVIDTVEPEIYETRREHLRRALAGERVSFEVESTIQGTLRSLQAVYTPDIQPDGSVAGIYTISTDVSAQKRIERQLNQLVRADALTGVANRYQFNEALPLALARGRRSGMALALMFLDIDHFKKINDTFGHAVGDAALKEFALRLVRSVRTTDTVARLGGDEFVVILEGLHRETEPQDVACKILAEFARPFDLDGQQLDVSTSLGIAYQPPVAVDPEELLARADAALYEAKQAGRNRFHVSMWAVSA